VRCVKGKVLVAFWLVEKVTGLRGAVAGICTAGAVRLESDSVRTPSAIPVIGIAAC
jgi:hypothetical protein